jgi:hypothetical protein
MPPRVSWAGQVGPQRPLAHWIAARLQTLDHGASEPLLVSRELGPRAELGAGFLSGFIIRLSQVVP